MISHDPQTCRRALREIGEIAAVTVLPGSQMMAQEALQTITAIAQWTSQEAPREPADCRDVIGRLNELTRSIDLETLGDREALKLFNEVIGALAYPHTSGIR